MTEEHDPNDKRRILLLLTCQGVFNFKHRTDDGNNESKLNTPRDVSNSHSDGTHPPRGVSNLRLEDSGLRNLEDLVNRVEKLERLEGKFEDKCVLYSFSGRMDYQATFHDQTWALLCGSCGLKVEERLKRA